MSVFNGQLEIPFADWIFPMEGGGRRRLASQGDKDQVQDLLGLSGTKAFLVAKRTTATRRVALVAYKALNNTESLHKKD